MLWVVGCRFWITGCCLPVTSLCVHAVGHTKVVHHKGHVKQNRVLMSKDPEQIVEINLFLSYGAV